MAKMPPCDMLALTAWDQRYSTTLPDSIRDFYLARCHQRRLYDFYDIVEQSCVAGRQKLSLYSY